MKLRLLLFGLLLSSVAPILAQDENVDVASLLADTKTFIFSNNRNTVKGYIYAEMKAKTTCCGTDRIYLEVKIDPSGYVLSAKTLTGRNDCFMQSAVDIVKNIKWNTDDFKGGPRSVYFEIKPDISCDGNRPNQYAAVPIFNNELLAGDGIAATPAPTRPTPPAAQPTQPAATPPPATTPAQPTQPAPSQPTASAPVATQPETAPESAPVAVPTTPVQPQVTIDTPAATSAPVVTAPQPKPPVKEDEPVVIETPQRLNEAPSTPPGTLPRRNEPIASAGPTDPPKPIAAEVELTEEQKQAQAQQEAERQRREDEIRQLKEEMARMRASEEQVRQQKIDEDKRRNEAAQSNDPFASSNSRAPSTGGRGGLFLDDLPYEGADEPVTGDRPSGQVVPGAKPDPGASEEDRIRNEIAGMEQRIRELEQTNRDVENDIRRRMQDAEKANREIIQIAEEKARRQEQAAQIREQRELDQIAENGRRIEDERTKQESEVQRLQDELARLQSEMQTRMTDLDRQRLEIDRIALERQQREQEIMLTRVLREKESEAELERLRLEKMNSSLFASASAPINANQLATDFATAADSEKYVMLLNQVVALQQEVNFLRQQLGQSPLPTVNSGNRTTTPQTPPSTPPNRTGQNNNTSSGAPIGNRADRNKEWEKIDIVAPGLTREDYYVTPRPAAPTPSPTAQTPTGSTPSQSGTSTPTTTTPAQDRSIVNYQPGKGYSPDPSHSDSHVNTAGPQFSERVYVDGEGALKELFKEDMRKGGVCGLAHVLFSVTLKPDGTVVNYQVLSSNSPLVTSQVGKLIPNLKFDAISGRYNQTVYQEVKAEIVCEGGVEVDLQSVQPIIRD